MEDSEIEPTDDVGEARNDFCQHIANGKEGARAKPEPPAATSAGRFLASQ
jgi:hypothetical protein